MDVAEKFRAASDRLDAARRAYANAESELIKAQQQYNDASREYVHERFDQPDAHRRRFDKLLASAVATATSDGRASTDTISGTPEELERKSRGPFSGI